MLLALASTALLMGLAGGSHCLAMCAAPCGALTGQGAAAGAARADPAALREAGAQPVVWVPRGSRAQRAAAFHVGRIAGYATAGALAALAVAWALGLDVERMRVGLRTWNARQIPDEPPLAA